MQNELKGNRTLPLSLSSSARTLGGPRYAKKFQTDFSSGRALFSGKPRPGDKVGSTQLPRNTIPGKFLRRNSELEVTRFEGIAFERRRKYRFPKAVLRFPFVFPRAFRVRSLPIEIAKLLSWKREREEKMFRLVSGERTRPRKNYGNFFENDLKRWEIGGSKLEKKKIAASYVSNEWHSVDEKWKRTITLRQGKYINVSETSSRVSLPRATRENSRGNRCKIATVNTAQINCTFEQGLKLV